ncbi:MAG TPA: type II secretion system F family protein [Armatimonadota bacterium]|nr:type II secretion system F family protein [Armatimonadota bacterium]
MATFTYVAKDVAGKRVKGSREADDAATAQKMLQDQGLRVTDLKEVASAANTKKSGGGGFMLGGVKLKDKSIFCRQFATMVNAGVSLVRCLDVLEQQTSSPRLKMITHQVRLDVEGGATLSRAMQEHPKAFDNLFLGLVRAGEVGGALDETLERLAVFLEKDMELRRKVKSAMTYPVIVMVAAVGIVGFLVYWILPQFAAMFKDTGVKQMPATTQFLIDTSNFVRQHTVMTFVIIIVAYLVFKLFVSTKFGKLCYDWFKLKVLIFGKLNHQVAISRFARTLGTLLSSGVPILQAFDTVAGAIDNVIISRAILSARDSIREGDSIARPLQKSKLFQPMVIHMVSIGEETGALDAMLGKIADFYEAEVDAALASLAATLEPVMIVILGFIVGFIVISMFMPLIAMIGGLSQG